MKFSENWLRSLVNPAVDRDELCRRLTMAGLEVEAVDALGGGLDGVVVGEIVECAPHPNADKLRVCQVSVGKGALLQIVCGAPNARVGLKVPLATIGAKLPNGVEIKKAALRGVESNGMLCSAKELALDADASQATAIMTGFVAGYSPSDNDHHLGNLEVRLRTEILAPRLVRVTAVFGLRDWSGDWDDRYEGIVHFAVLAE